MTRLGGRHTRSVILFPHDRFPMKTLVAQVGIAGYGDSYLSHLLGPRAAVEDVELVAVADIAPGRSPRLDVLRSKRCRILESFSLMLNQTEIDLLIVCTPIHLHEEQ